MTWHKADTRLQCSPRLRAIGAEHGTTAQQRATLVWLAVLAVNAEHDCDGKLDAIYADVGYLSTYCPAVNAIEFRAALQHLADAGLLELGDAGLVLPGWDETWRAVKTSTARVRQHRAIKAERDRQQKLAGGGRG